MNKNKGLIAALVAAGSFAGGMLAEGVADRLFRSTVARDAKWEYKGRSEDGHASPYYKYGDAKEKGAAWIDAQPADSVWIDSSLDDIRLYGRTIHCDEPRRIVLCIHGYRGSIHHFAGIAEHLHDCGCELLLADQRATGRSGGEWITFGAKEQYDVLDWLGYIESRNYAHLPVYMAGISMGASCVMCASGHELPASVAGMIADCGFTSMKEIVSETCSKWYSLPVAPLIKYTEKRCRRDAGFDMDEANAEEKLKSCRIPALFIHGTDDDFVPPEHTLFNYRACASDDKEIFWVEGAGHSCSCLEDPEGYRNVIARFFDKNDG